MWGMNNAYKLFVGKSEENRNNLETLVKHGRFTLRRNLNRVKTGFIALRIRSCGLHL
jgi:hypothetical protein